jgi:hypothetical protein
LLPTVLDRLWHTFATLRKEVKVTLVNGIRLVSNSEVQAYKDCPRKWWLAWYRGLRPRQRSVTGARSTGQRIHVALAALYSPGGKVEDALAALEREQEKDMNELNVQLITATFTEGDLESHDLILAEMRKSFDLEVAMIEGYLQWIEESGVDTDIEVIDTEKKVEVPLVPDIAACDMWDSPVHLIAKLDAQVRSLLTGRRKFIDHKTVATLRDPILGMNQQMLHYHVIDEVLGNGIHSDGALYNMLRKVKRTRASKPPYYARIPIDHNPTELKMYREQLYGMVDNFLATELDLKAGVGHHRACPSRPSRDCAWKCDFFKICRMFDDGSRVEAAIEEHYEVGDPLNYYEDKEDENE